MNIVPINVHAMQREIPFVNLLNYAYSFDEVVKNFIGVALKQNKVRDIGEDFRPVSVINP